MILPIGDRPNPRRPAIVNHVLIAVNVAVFVLLTLPLSYRALDPYTPGAFDYLSQLSRYLEQPVEVLLANLSAYDLVVFEHGFRPAEPSLADLFSSMFLHAGLLHLLGNMLFLWIFGDNVEARLGRLGYLLCYLATGIAATVFHSLFQWSSPMPMIGASGAISGVLGFYFLWFPENQVKLFVFLYWWVDVFLVPARWVLGFYLLVENLLPFLVTGDVGGVAYGAHLGGFLAGLVMASFVDHFQSRSHVRVWMAESSDSPLAVLSEDDDPGQSLQAMHVLRALQAERPDLAVRGYFELPWRERATFRAGDILAMGDWLVGQDRADLALTLYQQYLTMHPRDPELAAIHLRAGLIRLYRHGRPTDAYQHLAAALRCDPPPGLRAQIERALADIERLQAMQGRWERR